MAMDAPRSAADRTRRAIIDAATAVLAHDSRASLGEVARAAGVGRTTLHRYYPDRATLVRALAHEAFDATEQAFIASGLDTGSATEALGRLLHEMITLGDRFVFLLREPSLADDPEVEAAEKHSGAVIQSLIERGQASGEFASELPAPWIAKVVGSLVYGAWLAVDSRTVPRADAARLATATLLGGIGRRGRGLAPPGRGSTP
jgi:TetR/AcrR family transcriptional regulator, repressor for lfrA